MLSREAILNYCRDRALGKVARGRRGEGLMRLVWKPGAWGHTATSHVTLGAALALIVA